jgi:hypothetical protein
MPTRSFCSRLSPEGKTDDHSGYVAPPPVPRPVRRGRDRAVVGDERHDRVSVVGAAAVRRRPVHIWASQAAIRRPAASCCGPGSPRIRWRPTGVAACPRAPCRSHGRWPRTSTSNGLSEPGRSWPRPSWGTPCTPRSPACSPAGTTFTGSAPARSSAPFGCPVERPRPTDNHGPVRLRHRGYLRCTLTPQQWRSDYRVVASAADTTALATTRTSWIVENGCPGAQPA